MDCRMAALHRMFSSARSYESPHEPATERIGDQKETSGHGVMIAGGYQPVDPDRWHEDGRRNLT